MARWRTRRRRRDEGSSAVEFALVAPFLILMVVGTVDYGFASYQRMAAQHAAQVGAQQAALHGFDQTAIVNAVEGATVAAHISATPLPSQSCGCVDGTTFTTAACGTKCADGSNAGTYVSVSARVVYTTLLPYPGIPDSFTFNESAFTRTQ
jgi:Flp pilus assembly protein TadG